MDEIIPNSILQFINKSISRHKVYVFPDVFVLSTNIYRICTIIECIFIYQLFRYMT